MLTRTNSAVRSKAGSHRRVRDAQSGRTARGNRLSRMLAALSAVAICFSQMAPPSPAQDPSAGVSTAPPAPAAAQAKADDRTVITDAIFYVTGRRSNVEVTENLSKVIELSDARITKVDGFDPTVIDVKALTPNRIRVQALIQGVTTLVLTDVNDKSYVIEVFVKGDTRHLQAVIDNRFPDSAIEAYKIQDSVALTGWVAQPEHITQIVEIAEQFYPRVLNQMRVGGVQQVQLKVRIMEVQRSKMRRMGFDFVDIGNNGYFRSNPAELFALDSVTASGGNLGATLANSSISAASTAFGLVSDKNVLFGFFDALRREELLKILAEPVLVTTNGRPASMLSGGEFPVLVPQSLGVVSIEWRDFGIRMEAVPIILGDGRVRLEVMPEVSERDFSNSVSVGGNVVPALTTRRVNTEVEMRFGQTLMLTGLISTRQTAQTSKIPVLGELPFVGAAFRKTSYEDVETELVITLTPELVAPMKQQQVPYGGPGQFTTFPTDRELFLDGYLEVPNYGDACLSCGRLGTCGPDGCLTSAATPQTFTSPIQEQTIPAVAPKSEAAEQAIPAPDRTAAAAAALREARPSNIRVATETLPIGQRTVSPPNAPAGTAQQVGYQQPSGARQTVLPAGSLQSDPTAQSQPVIPGQPATQMQPAARSIPAAQSRPADPQESTRVSPDPATSAIQKRRPPATWNPLSKKPQPKPPRTAIGASGRTGTVSQSGSAGPSQITNRSALPGLIEP